MIDIKKLDESLEILRARLGGRAIRGGVMLGSGWSEAVDPFTPIMEVPFEELPVLGSVGVQSHAGKIQLIEQGGSFWLLFLGRRHWYEGEGWTPVIAPAYLLAKLDAKIMLLTNAAGGIRDDCGPGKLCAISDHINMLGDNPLIGPHLEALGVRFPDMSAIYAPHLRLQLLDSGVDAEGVYVAATGPSFETPAEIRAFKVFGADVVGMSTVPEAIIGNALGLEVAALSCVCNWAAGLSLNPLTHEEVSETAQATMPRMRAILKRFVEGNSE